MKTFFGRGIKPLKLKTTRAAVKARRLKIRIAKKDASKKAAALKEKRFYGTKGQGAGRGGSLAEIMVRARLEAEGYTVLQRGWPDFCAVRDSEVRFIEVKKIREKLSSAQLQLHLVLKLLGIDVGVIHQVLDYSFKLKPPNP